VTLRIELKTNCGEQSHKSRNSADLTQETPGENSPFQTPCRLKIPMNMGPQASPVILCHSQQAKLYAYIISVC